MRWVLTRELEDAKPLADELKLDVVPCIERHDLPWPAWPKSPLVFVTSAHVAKRLRWLTVVPGTRIAALLPVTATVLARPDISAEGGAVALAHAAVKWAAGKPPVEVLYPTSDQGLDQPEQLEAVKILEGIGRVHRHVVYETRAPLNLAESLARHRGDGFVFFSPSAVRHFIAAGGVAAKVLCVGESTAKAWPGPPPPLLATTETVKKVIKENV
ncbi:MAG: uroporphyrinogen-III synthase [Myxococcaceae bacterium]|nr:uroporphyrinogen-III synthase [Myxococcaceae bacterium]